jgi:aspartate-semialdehyde dehydrogenase
MKIGIVGVTGLVGLEILKSLDLLNLNDGSNEFHMYGSERSDGELISYGDTIYIVKKFINEYILALDYCILAVDNAIAKSIITYAQDLKSSCCIIDNSSEFRLEKNVPLVIPEINVDVLKKCNKLISNPNCTTTMLVMLLCPLLKMKDIDIKHVVVSTYQAASGAGVRGYTELTKQLDEWCSDKTVTTMDFWKKQYVCNVFSHNSSIDPKTLYNQEELKIVYETKKILNKNIKISPSCVRVPTLRSHFLSVNVEFNRDVKMDEINKVLLEASGIVLCDDPEHNEFPEPVKTAGKTDIYIGRIRPDIDDLTRWNFFVSGDQLLKGAAYNSVQILKYMIDL